MDIKRVIICRVGEPTPEVKNIANGLHAMQAVVGGLIECVRLADGIDLWVNEEGLFTCEPNRLACVNGRNIPIHGDCFISASTSDGESRSLTTTECIKWLQVVAGWPVCINALIPKGAN